MAGRERSVFDHCLPLLSAMGKTVAYIGTNGNGQKTKMVNQTVGALNLLATVEGLRLASAAGLDLEDTLRIVGGGTSGAWTLANLGSKIAKGDFAPAFTIRLQDKDLRLASEFSHELGLDAPGATLTSALFHQAVENGSGDLGNQGLYQCAA
jgi:3-hydroxyisobutyrate dehydrogenase